MRWRAHSVIIPITADERLVPAGDLSELYSSVPSYAPQQLRREVGASSKMGGVARLAKG